jgi:hypothetical protein
MSSSNLKAAAEYANYSTVAPPTTAVAKNPTCYERNE